MARTPRSPTSALDQQRRLSNSSRAARPRRCDKFRSLLNLLCGRHARPRDEEERRWKGSVGLRLAERARLSPSTTCENSLLRRLQLLLFAGTLSSACLTLARTQSVTSDELRFPALVAPAAGFAYPLVLHALGALLHDVPIEPTVVSYWANAVGLLFSFAVSNTFYCACLPRGTLAGRAGKRCLA